MTSVTQKKKRDLSRLVGETDWEFSDADTKHLTHEIHRYSGKYIPQIARKAMELVSVPGETIVDPYVGSGTTLLEANLIGRHSIGIDLNPLAVLISTVKTTPIDDGRLDKLFSYFNKLSQELIEANRGVQSLWGEESSRISKDPRKEDPWFSKWFNAHTLNDLLLIHEKIETYPDAEAAAVAKVAFSNILRRCSNAHSGYPNVMFDRKKNNQTSPAPLFTKSLNDLIFKVRNLNTKFTKNTRTKVIHGDATNLPLEDESADAVITHPPYIGSVPYAEYGVLSLKWFGFDPKEIDGKLTGGKRQSKDVVQRFAEGYKKMIEESYRVLRPQRYFFVLVGDPTVKGEVVDLAQMTRDLASSAGFSLEAENKRNGVNRRANKMGAETLLFFRK